MRVLKFLQIKEGGATFWGGGGGKQFCRTSDLFGRPFCSSILKVLRTQFLRHTLEFNAFFIILQIKEGDLISGETQFCRKAELFGPPFCIPILQVLSTYILCHQLDINTVCMIQEFLSQTFEISAN